MFVQPTIAHLQVLGATSLPLLTPCSLVQGSVVSDPAGKYLFSHCDEEHGKTFLIRAGTLVVLAGQADLLGRDKVAYPIHEFIGKRVTPAALLGPDAFHDAGPCIILDAAWSKATFPDPRDAKLPGVKRLVFLTEFSPITKDPAHV